MNHPINIAFFEIGKREAAHIWRRVHYVPRIGEVVNVNGNFRTIREVFWREPYIVELTFER